MRCGQNGLSPCFLLILVIRACCRNPDRVAFVADLVRLGGQTRDFFHLVNPPFSGMTDFIKKFSPVPKKLMLIINQECPQPTQTLSYHAQVK